MIKYFCETCNIQSDLSTCSVCGERTQIKSKLYWCKECNIPLYEDTCSLCGSKGKESTTDIRPVFPEERLLIEILIGEPFKFLKSSVWNGTGNRFIVDGEPLKISISKLMQMNSKEVIKKLDSIAVTREDQFKNEHFFDEFLEKWDKGEYHD